MTTIDLSAFEASCGEFILQGKSDKVLPIINAFNDVDNRFDFLRKLIELSPHSLDGMLLLFHIKDMREQKLDFTVWPHSVLLESAINIQNMKEFISLLNAVEQTVLWEDTFACLQKLVSKLSVKILEDIVSNIGQLGQLRALLLAYIFEAMVKNQELYSFSPSDLLVQVKNEIEQIGKKKVYYSLAASWTKQTWGQKDIFPETLYMLILFEVMKILPSEQFSEDYDYFHKIAYEFFYRETNTFSRWNKRERFLWAYKRILSLISNDLVDSWQSLMQEVEDNWNS